MTRTSGFTLIEVVVVLAIVALSVGLAGPRIGAGLGRLELINSARTVRGVIRKARFQAGRTDREQYVFLDKTRRSVALVNSDLMLVSEETLPQSIEMLLEGDASTMSLVVGPSGTLRGVSPRLRSRMGEVEISLH